MAELPPLIAFGQGFRKLTVNSAENRWYPDQLEVLNNIRHARGSGFSCLHFGKIGHVHVSSIVSCRLDRDGEDCPPLVEPV
jgi:hypothetical protein